MQETISMQETGVRSLGREDTWRREWQSTPVLLPGKSHEPWQTAVHGFAKESDTT